MLSIAGCARTCAKHRPGDGPWHIPQSTPHVPKAIHCQRHQARHAPVHSTHLKSSSGGRPRCRPITSCCRWSPAPALYPPRPPPLKPPYRCRGGRKAAAKSLANSASAAGPRRLRADRGPRPCARGRPPALAAAAAAAAAPALLVRVLRWLPPNQPPSRPRPQPWCLPAGAAASSAAAAASAASSSWKRRCRLASASAAVAARRSSSSYRSQNEQRQGGAGSWSKSESQKAADANKLLTTGC